VVYELVILWHFHNKYMGGALS